MTLKSLNHYVPCVPLGRLTVWAESPWMFLSFVFIILESMLLGLCGGRLLPSMFPFLMSHILQCDSVLPPFKRWGLSPHPLGPGWTCDWVSPWGCGWSGLCSSRSRLKRSWTLYLFFLKHAVLDETAQVCLLYEEGDTAQLPITLAHSLLTHLSSWAQKIFSPHGWPVYMSYMNGGLLKPLNLGMFNYAAKTSWERYQHGLQRVEKSLGRPHSRYIL